MTVSEVSTMEDVSGVLLPVWRHPKKSRCEWGVMSDLPVQIVVVVPASIRIRCRYLTQLDPGPALSGRQVTTPENAADDLGIRVDFVEGDVAVERE